jgi:eukaryotic-like serine/threonine-protein kinase
LKRRVFLAGAAGLALAVWNATPGASQPPEWWVRLDEADAALQAGRLDDAEALYLAAKETGERHGSRSLPLGRALDGLGDVALRRDHPEEAERFYRRALEIWEAILGPEQPRTAITLTNLGAAVLAQGKADEAETWFRRSLSALEAARGPDHPDLAPAITNLARVLRKLGRGSEAVELERRLGTLRPPGS